MIELFDVQSGSKIGDITEDQLQFLVDQLEEESFDDQDYYINPATLDHFEEKDADPELLTLLRNALGENDSMDIRWQQG
jgi:processive 1,2-diacylglycerol beta-glucosyltransferase